MSINWTRLGSMQQELENQSLANKLHTRTYCARRRARRGHGTSYTVDRTELEILQDQPLNQFSPFWRPYPSQTVSLQQAFTRLQTPTPDTAETRAAAQRIGAFLNSNSPVKWDLCVKVFNDYDTVLFHGDLRRRVYLSWRAYSEMSEIVASGLELYAVGMTQPRHTTPEKIPRISITLRADVDWSVLPRLTVLGVLVHEMLHAFLLVHAGYPGILELPNRGYNDQCHGQIWNRGCEVSGEEDGS